MENEWGLKPLEVLSEYISRGAAPSYTEEGGFLVINQRCIRDFRVDLGAARRTDPEKRRVAPDRMLQVGDILINSTGVGTLGRVAQIHQVLEPTTVDSHVTIVRPLEGEIDSLYLGYAIKRYQGVLETLGHGSTGQTELSRQAICELTVPVPPLKHQLAIASMLKALDDKIELNRRMNETLEEISATYFKAWLQEVGIGHLPIEGTLADIIEFDPPERLRRGAEAPYLGLAHIPNSGMIHEAPDDRPYTSGARFRDGDTLLARITPSLENGKTAIALGIGRSTVAWGSTELIVMRPIEPVPVLVPYLISRDPAFRAHAVQNMSGTSGRQRVPREALMRFPFPTASRQEWLNLNRLMAPVVEAVWIRAQESRTLAELRDALLPKLISGEIRVPEAEQIVSEVA